MATKKNQRSTQYRQGDVLLVSVAEVPEAKSVARVDGRYVLAYGEVTGHAHAIVATPDVQVVETTDGVMYVSAHGISLLRHEEHGDIKIAPGAYRVVRQREYSPEEIRRVAD